MDEDVLLKVNGLQVSFDTREGEVEAVRGISFTLNRGEAMVIVGESGCGKSVTAQTIMRLNAEPPSRIKSGSILLEGQDLVQMKEKQMEQIRGSQVGMIFQDPMTSLNPTMTVGKQVGKSGPGSIRPPSAEGCASGP